MITAKAALKGLDVDLSKAKLIVLVCQRLQTAEWVLTLEV